MSFKPKYLYEITYNDKRFNETKSKVVMSTRKDHLLKYVVKPMEEYGYDIVSIYNKADKEKTNIHTVR